MILKNAAFSPDGTIAHDKFFKILDSCTNRKKKKKTHLKMTLLYSGPGILVGLIECIKFSVQNRFYLFIFLFCFGFSQRFIDAFGK